MTDLTLTERHRRTEHRPTERWEARRVTDVLLVTDTDQNPDLILPALAARCLCHAVRADGFNHVLLVVVTEAGIAGVASDWQLDDVLLTTATPAEVDMRLRLAESRFKSDVSV